MWGSEHLSRLMVFDPVNHWVAERWPFRKPGFRCLVFSEV